MSLISKDVLLTHLQRAEMADSVSLPIEFFRDLIYQAMPREWVGLTEEEVIDLWPDLILHQHVYKFWQNLEAKLKEKNNA